jgi:hypothetical protein
MGASVIDATKINKRREQLRQNLLELRQADNLYPSNLDGDSRHSFTVSSLALFALTELQDPTRDLVYRAIVASAQDGTWPAQGEPQGSHTITAAWALFSCTRCRLDAVRDMAPTVVWLQGLQEKGGGWPHTEGTDARPFHTALVLNALPSYREQLSFDSPDDQRVTSKSLTSSIEKGFDYLTKRSRSHAADTMWLWDVKAGGSGVCLGTSGLCLHVALRAATLKEFDYLRAPACQALALIANAMKPQALNSQYLQFTDELRARAWPTIELNVPNYWYAYFSPLMALTFAEAIAHDPANAATYRQGIEECIRWIVEEYEPLGNDHNAKGVWAIAHAVIVLERAGALSHPAETRPSGGKATIAAQLRRLGPELTAVDGNFNMVCEAIDPSLKTKIPKEVSSQAQWSELIDQIDGKPAQLLRALSAVLDFYPGSKAADAIRQWMKGS